MFLSAMTLMNHGTHRRRLFADDRHRERRAAALAESGSEEYAEYYVRLAESAQAYAAFRRKVAASGRPLLIVTYGDHQPSFTRQLLRRIGGGDGALFRTFYAIDPVNMVLPADLAVPRDMDAVFVGTVALMAAGLPLDDIFATRASLIGECGANYYAADSVRKRRFHRMLLDRGCLDLPR
jgi:hypothetical protein